MTHYRQNPVYTATSTVELKRFYVKASEMNLYPWTAKTGIGTSIVASL